MQSSYREQSGDEAVELFGPLWGKALHEGKSTPRLILEAVRRLNNLSTPEMIARGRASLLAGADDATRSVEQHDFLRLVQARARREELGATCRQLVQQLAAQGVTEDVRLFARSVLDDLGRAADPAGEITRVLAGAAADDALEARTALWMKEATAANAVPTLVADMGSLLCFAAERALTDYATATREYDLAYPSGYITSAAEAKAFAAIVAQPGTSLKDKVQSYLASLAARPLPELWTAFAGEPEAGLQPVIIARYAKDIGPDDARRLVKWTLDSESSPALRAASLSALEGLLDALGFASLSRAPADAQPRPATPAHWLLAALDEALATKLAGHKTAGLDPELVGLLARRCLPEELPHLRDRLSTIMVDGAADWDDRSLVKGLLLPDEAGSPVARAWSEALLRAALRDGSGSLSSHTALCNHLRLVVAPSLPPHQDFSAHPAFDARLREATLHELASLSGDQAASCALAVEMLGTAFFAQRRADDVVTRYAIASHPAFAMGLEKQLVEKLAGPADRLRQEVVRLVSMFKPGFLPAVDEYVAKSLQPTEQEAEILALRRLLR